MSLVNGHNFYFDLFEEVESSSAVFTEDESAAATWARDGRVYYTVGEIENLTVAKVESADVGDLIYGNEQG